MNMVTRFFAIVVLLSACQSTTAPAPVTQAPSTTSTPTQRQRVAPGHFDGLTITLELKALSVRSGATIGSTLTVRNDSGKTIIDPECVIGSGRYALVPVDDPDAELWLQPVVDCSGAFKMPDGFIERSAGPTFRATTKHGEALPPGQYIATLEIEGYSERLQQPVEVVD